MATLVLSPDQERVFLAGPDEAWDPIESELLAYAASTFDGDASVVVKVSDGSVGFFIRGPYSRPLSADIPLPGDTAWRAIYP